MKYPGFRAIVSAVLATTVIVMVAVCCCTLKPLMAKAQVCSHCHAQSTSQKADPQSHACCLTKLAPFESAVQSFVLTPSIEKIVYAMTHAVEFAFTPVKIKFNLAYLDGPPGIVNEIPLYLKTHSLRV